MTPLDPNLPCPWLILVGERTDSQDTQFLKKDSIIQIFIAVMADDDANQTNEKALKNTCKYLSQFHIKAQKNYENFYSSLVGNCKCISPVPLNETDAFVNFTLSFFNDELSRPIPVEKAKSPDENSLKLSPMTAGRAFKISLPLSLVVERKGSYSYQVVHCPEVENFPDTVNIFNQKSIQNALKAYEAYVLKSNQEMDEKIESTPDPSAVQLVFSIAFIACKSFATWTGIIKPDPLI